ncbi:MAG: isocitrate lyase/phosphoenolpyruvate mutase family protein [Shimia sp.]
MTAFADLHRPGDPFVLVNVWDRGTARMAAAMGAQAIATSSAAHAFTLGRPDGRVTLEEALNHATDLAAATSLPLSIDFEDGYAARPEEVAANIARAAETGAAGVSIEDWNDGTAYDRVLAIERIAAAVEACRAGGLLLCARADGVMQGAYDVTEALQRAAAFAEAGAECIYVPHLPDAAALADVVAIGTPVNGLAAGKWLDWSAEDWAAAGVARISLGSTLSRVEHRALYDAMGGLLGGDLPALKHDPVAPTIDALLTKGTP